MKRNTHLFKGESLSGGRALWAGYNRVAQNRDKAAGIERVLHFA